jgi:hypothetical protein
MPRPLPFLVTLAVLSLSSLAPAQNPAKDEPQVCLGFAFGAWTPPLDWRAAGHGAMPDSSRLQRAPSGRDWASDAGAGEPDSLLILFPKWWPAGVSVELPTRTPAPGDTVVGRAVAFVANGARKSPTSSVRAWRVGCGGARSR